MGRRVIATVLLLAVPGMVLAAPEPRQQGSISIISLDGAAPTAWPVLLPGRRA